MLVFGTVLITTTAILARTNRSLRAYEDALSTRGIRYYLLGKSGFWQQPEIKNVMAYVQCAVVPHDAAVLAALRAPFHPSKFIRKKELIEKLKGSVISEETQSVWSALRGYVDPNHQQHVAISEFRVFLKNQASLCQNLPAGQAVNGIIASLNAIAYYRDEEESSDNDPVQNLQELVHIADRFQTLPEFLGYVRKVKGASRKKTGVAVGTVHAAKGLEFDHVFLVNVTEGVLPHVRGLEEEERRIFFVGCSRAAKTLTLSYSGVASSFLGLVHPQVRRLFFDKSCPPTTAGSEIAAQSIGQYADFTRRK